MLRSDNARTLLRLWLDARGDAAVPQADAFGPQQLREILPYVTVIRVQAGEPSRISLCGTAICEAAGFDPTGWEMLRLYPEEEHERVREAEAFLSSRCYINHSLRLFAREGGGGRTVEQLFVPVAGSDGMPERYVMVLDNLDVLSNVDVGRTASGSPMGRLIERTFYDPATLDVIDSPLLLPPLTERDSAENLRHALRSGGDGV